MKPCGKLAVPGAPGKAGMSFQTRTQTAEGLQLPKRWVIETLCQLERGKEWGKGGGGEKDRRERTMTRGWGEWWRSEAECKKPQLSSNLMERRGSILSLTILSALWGTRLELHLGPQSIISYLPTQITACPNPNWEPLMLTLPGSFGSSHNKPCCNWSCPPVAGDWNLS